MAVSPSLSALSSISFPLDQAIHLSTILVCLTPRIIPSIASHSSELFSVLLHLLSAAIPLFLIRSAVSFSFSPCVIDAICTLTHIARLNLSLIPELTDPLMRLPSPEIASIFYTEKGSYYFISLFFSFSITEFFKSRTSRRHIISQYLFNIIITGEYVLALDIFYEYGYTKLSTL